MTAFCSEQLPVILLRRYCVSPTSNTILYRYFKSTTKDVIYAPMDNYVQIIPKGRKGGTAK